MEYAHLLEKKKSDLVCGIQESHWALPWTGGGGCVPESFDGLFYVKRNHPSAVSGTASIGTDRRYRHMVLGTVQQLIIQQAVRFLWRAACFFMPIGR